MSDHSAIRRRCAWDDYRERQLTGLFAMQDTDILPVNFTISPSAKQEIEVIRQQWNEQLPDPAAVLSVSWGLFHFNSGERSENVVISFYGESELSKIAHGIQRVSDMDVVFFTIPAYHSKFEGKIIDHEANRGFFLREP
jgi:hypothetical protein